MLDWASAKRWRVLPLIEQTVEHLDGILITHEHTDHCNGLPQMLGLWKAPLYVTEPTLEALQRRLPETSGEAAARRRNHSGGAAFHDWRYRCACVSIPHDAADPVGFTFRTNGAKMALVTDLGYMPELVKVHLRGCGLFAAGIESRSGHAEGGAVSVGGEAAGAEPHGPSFESCGERISLPIPTGLMRRLGSWCWRTFRRKTIIRIWCDFRPRRRFGTPSAECAFRGELLVASQHVPLQAARTLTHRRKKLRFLATLGMTKLGTVARPTFCSHLSAFSITLFLFLVEVRRP